MKQRTGVVHALASIARHCAALEFVDALALDGLDDEGGHVTRAQFLRQRVDVTEGNLTRPG